MDLLYVPDIGLQCLAHVIPAIACRCGASAIGQGPLSPSGSDEDVLGQRQLGQRIIIIAGVEPTLVDVGSPLFILDPKRVVANRLLSVSAPWGVDVGSHALLSFGVNPQTTQNGNQHYPCIAIAYLWGLDSGAAHPTTSTSENIKFIYHN